jgi:hypothetical protein
VEIKWDIAELHRLYIDEEMSINDIANLKRYSIKAVTHALRRYEIPIRTRVDALRTLRTKDKMQKSARQRCNMMGYKEKVSIELKNRWANPEYKDRQRQIIKQRWNIPEYRMKMLEVVEKSTIDRKINFRPKYSLPTGTIEHPNFGDVRRRKDFTLQLRKSKINAHYNEGYVAWYPCPMCGSGHWVHYANFKPEITGCPSCVNGTRSRLAWSNPVYKERTIKAIRSAANIQPNKCEQQLQSILDKIYPNTWKFIGDGKSLNIDGLIPDFWNGDHKLIELFGTWWHSKEKIGDNWKRSELGREWIFNAYGYKTLIIWEDELKQPNLLIQKIKQFVRNKISKSGLKELKCANHL